MSPPRNVFTNFPPPRLLQSPPNLGVQDQNTQDEDEDLGPFETDVLSNDEGYKSNEDVPVSASARRFKETLREPKPPRVKQHSHAKSRSGEVDIGFVLSKLTPECLSRDHRQFCCTKTCVWNLGIKTLYHELRQPSAQAFILLEWLDSFFLSHCERQPGDGKYHLPNNFTKKEVYDHYKTDMSQLILILFGISFPAEAIEVLQLHMKQHAEERAAAGHRRWKALDTRKDCAYIQIDGMDQKKTALPHFSKQPKSVDGAALVGVHLVGAMVFHGKMQTRAFLTYNNIKPDMGTSSWCKNFVNADGARLMLASQQLPLKSYAEIKRQTKSAQNIGTLETAQEGDAVRHVHAIRQDIQAHCYPFFDDVEKDWWNHWFFQQEDIGRKIGRSIRERLTGDMCWLWSVPPERDAEEEVELLAVTTAEDLRRRVLVSGGLSILGPGNHHQVQLQRIVQLT
ncbi:hypothetical protein R1sor_000705 [Riccia sorocarpa]|uniref:Uncharacterized protein n=1 Tax=Riccia sorocarpa TaxID=122646 RepID=A0ABD3GTX5_9MARC